jgi:ubiquinol-cytochrome c reductase cytochrome c1 subunit
MRKTAYWISFFSLLAAAGQGYAAPDFAAIQRGAHVAVEVCNGCHDLKYLKYKDLLAIGLPQSEVDAMRGSKSMGDPLKGQMQPNDALAAFNVVPPDLSLMAKAREGGSEYIYHLLTGFKTDASGATTNAVFPGIKMPDILGISLADANARKDIENKAKDVSAFLEWAADPQAEARQRMGVGVLIYVAVLTVLFYFLKNKIWLRLKR